jgi:hypothetical protein
MAKARGYGESAAQKSLRPDCCAEELDARLLRRRAYGKTAAQKSASRKNEQWACLLPKNIPAKLSMNRLAQASFDRRFGMFCGNVIPEN